MITEEYSNLIQSISSIVSVGALIPSIFIFFKNQREQLKSQREQLELARDLNHRYIIEQYREFLGICLQYPEISLETGSPKKNLDENTRIRRDIAFDILTATFERAYITYVVNNERSDANQWHGWDSYIQGYCNRSDYLEWVRRYLFGNDKRRFFELGATQYDVRFEKFFYEKLVQPFKALEQHGAI